MKFSCSQSFGEGQRLGRLKVFIAYKIDDHDWMHDVLYRVPIPTSGEPTYRIIDPGAETKYERYRTVSKSFFFPTKDNEVVLGWHVKGRVGKDLSAE